MYNKFNNKRRFLWLKQEKVRKKFMFTHIPRKTVQRLKYTIGQPLIQAKGKNSVEHSLLLGCASRSFSLRLFICCRYSIESLHIAQTEMTSKQFYEHDYIFYLIGYHIIFGQTTYVHLQTQIYVFSPTLASILTIIF